MDLDPDWTYVGLRIIQRNGPHDLSLKQLRPGRLSLRRFERKIRFGPPEASDRHLRQEYLHRLLDDIVHFVVFVLFLLFLFVVLFFAQRRQNWFRMIYCHYLSMFLGKYRARPAVFAAHVAWEGKFVVFG